MSSCPRAPQCWKMLEAGTGPQHNLIHSFTSLNDLLPNSRHRLDQELIRSILSSLECVRRALQFHVAAASCSSTCVYPAAPAFAVLPSCRSRLALFSALPFRHACSPCTSFQAAQWLALAGIHLCVARQCRLTLLTT